MVTMVWDIIVAKPIGKSDPNAIVVNFFFLFGKWDIEDMVQHYHTWLKGEISKKKKKSEGTEWKVNRKKSEEGQIMVLGGYLFIVCLFNLYAAGSLWRMTNHTY